MVEGFSRPAKCSTTTSFTLECSARVNVNSLSNHNLQACSPQVRPSFAKNLLPRDKNTISDFSWKKKVLATMGLQSKFSIVFCQDAGSPDCHTLLMALSIHNNASLDPGSIPGSDLWHNYFHDNPVKASMCAAILRIYQCRLPSVTCSSP